MKKETFINEKQRIYLGIFIHWIKVKMNKMSGQTSIRVIGTECSLIEYYSLIRSIKDKDYYDRVEKDILNELRVRYIYNSLDYHLAMSLP